MRERALDEFESIFEQASIPVLDIEEISLRRVSLVLKGDPLDASAIRVATYLKKRFGADIIVHRRANIEDATLASIRSQGLTWQDAPFASTAELVGLVSIARSQLLVVPVPACDERATLNIDALVQGTAPPILMLKKPIAEPADVFGRILHSLTGNFQQTQNFSHSFTLVEDKGALVLLHAIDQADIADLQDAMSVAPDISHQGEAELLNAIAHHGERYLKAVVAARRTRPYDVSYRLIVGDVVQAVLREAGTGGYGMVVVGCHEEGHSHVSASDYELMHVIQDLPVLAL